MTQTVPNTEQSVTAARTAEETLRNAVGFLRARQDTQGWWKGELATNVTMDAEDLLLRQFLGILRPDQAEEAARWIRSQQREDGTWATFPGGPGELSSAAAGHYARPGSGCHCDRQRVPPSDGAHQHVAPVLDRRPDERHE